MENYFDVPNILAGQEPGVKIRPLYGSVDPHESLVPAPMYRIIQTAGA